ncbi:hypothetical cytosolic protein [Syntrophus aciditrophicus SB]|uniref:Hypothetical cytosolic protein n=1 Tax=Syntrophus aciditrophicus (strain SB) TaxID=56780 RepID=Q2LUE7_SYNAS|nr:hypothetical cytosolic protein [Syntrophus aciditrophicus SB]
MRESKIELIKEAPARFFNYRPYFDGLSISHTSEADAQHMRTLLFDADGKQV